MENGKNGVIVSVHLKAIVIAVLGQGLGKLYNYVNF